MLDPRDYSLVALVAICNEQKNPDAYGQNKDEGCGGPNYGPSGTTTLTSKPSISDISKLPIAGRTMFYVPPNRIVERNLLCPERLEDFRSEAPDSFRIGISGASKLIYRIIGHRRNTLSLATGYASQSTLR
ncbi:MAG: hypothetical protein ACJ746_12510 [Bryobacteraceae bacterium]